MTIEAYTKAYSIPYYYYCLYPVSLVPWDAILDPYISWSSQEDLINTTVHNSNHPYPPPLKYSIAFVKRLVSELAKLTDEVHDVWYEYIADNTSKLQSCDSDKGYVSYQLSEDSVITLQYDISGKFIEQGTTGLSQWEAGRYLASWLVTNNVVRDKKVLELGAGSGLVGLVAGKVCGARDACLTDGNPLVVKALEGNVKVNNCCSKVKTAQLIWGEDNKGEGELIECADVIVGADLTYDPTIVGALMATIRRMSPTAVCYLCSAVRTESTWEEFTKHWGDLEVTELLRYPSQWESIVRDEFLAGRCPRPSELGMDIVLLEIKQPLSYCNIVPHHQEQIHLSLGA